MRVFVTHNREDLVAYFGRALPKLKALDGVTVVTNPGEGNLGTDELVEAAVDCQVIIAHRSTPGEAPLFEQLPELLAMFRTAIDISTIDVAAASQNGVLVANADKSFIASTAELALGLLIDCARNISASTFDYRSGVEPPQRSGRQLRGATAGIIGYGSIGSYLAGLLSAIGMRVLVCDPAAEPGLFDREVDSHAVPAPEMVELEPLLRNSDVVFPLTPGDEANHHLISTPELALMRSDAILINVSRGEVLDEQAVADALQSGRLGAVGLDVGMGQDQRPSAVLAGLPRVVATPHLGGLTPANADAQAKSAVDQVASLLARSMPARSVNPEAATRLTSYWARQAGPRGDHAGPLD